MSPSASTFAVAVALLATGAAGLTWQEAGCHHEKDVMDCSDDRTGGDLTAVPTGIPADTVHLWLSSNRIAAIAATDLQGLVNLRYLYLENNGLSSIAAGSFNDLAGLKFLLLDSNQLESFPQGLFARCGALTNLDLRNNLLSSVQGATFFGLSSLTHLNIYGNAIAEIGCGSFNHVQTLRYINTGGNPSVCAPTGTGELECRCGGDGVTTGNEGYCSATNAACSFNPPIFESFTTTTTVTPPTEDDMVSGDNRVAEGDVVGPNQIPDDTIDGEELAADVASPATDGSASVVTLAAGVAACVVAVVALFGTVMLRSRANRQYMLEAAATKTSSASSARSPSAHGSELGSDAASNQDRLSSRNASSATSKSSKSDRIELHWDDGTTETDTDWNVDATNAHHDRDDDGCSIATDSALSVASSSGMSSLTVKSSILNKFMNYATGVWQKDVFTEDDDLKADSRAQYDDSRSQYDGSLVTSVSAGITNCEDANPGFDADPGFVLNHSSTASTLPAYEGDSNSSSPSQTICGSNSSSPSHTV